MAKTVKKKMTETPALEGVVFNAEGKKSGTVTLPAEVFGVRWNPDLVHQVVSALKENARTPIAHTKGRGEVRGGGRKPWKQKGTGRARHGSTRSPIWVGGGIAHGPRNEKNFSQKVNRKMRARALFSALSKKFGEGEISFLEGLSFSKPATRDAKAVFAKLSATKEFGGIERKRNAALIALPARDENVEKSFRNFGNTDVVDIRNLNPIDALTYRRIIIVNPEASLSVLAKRAE